MMVTRNLLHQGRIHERTNMFTRLKELLMLQLDLEKEHAKEDKKNGISDK
jgi:hypothetical protein